MVSGGTLFVYLRYMLKSVQVGFKHGMGAYATCIPRGLVVLMFERAE